MNNAQRKELADAIAHIKIAFEDTRRWLESLEGHLEEFKTLADTMATDEDEKFENLNEGFQASERGQAIEEARDRLNEMKDAADEALTLLSDLKDKVEDVTDGDLP